MGPFVRHTVIVAIGGLLGCATGQSGLHRKAQTTLAREDARGLGSAPLARHPNPYVRVEALRRMEARAARLDDAEVAAAVDVLEDEARVFNEFCRGVVDAPEPLIYEQGTAYIRGRCQDGADTPAAHATALLSAAPAERVVRAIVARAVARHRPVLDSGARDILRARGPEASAALLDALASALPGADPKTTAALLQAAAFAALGSRSPVATALVERAMSASDARVQARGRAAVLRLTDRPGPEPAPWTAGSRATAASALASQIATDASGRHGFEALPALTDIGPSAAPLLDAILALLRSYPTAVLEAVKAIGPRARRASDALIAFDKELPRPRSYEAVDEYRAQILDALVAIGAPADDVEALARLRMGGSMELTLSVVAALGAVGAKMSGEDLDGLDATHAAECSTGLMVRKSGDSVKECDRLAEAIETLRKSNAAPKPERGPSEAPRATPRGH